MKRLLLSGAAALAISSAAWAADPVVFVEEVVPPPPADIWDGVFIGLLGGYSWAQDGIDVHSYSYHDMRVRGPLFPNPQVAAPLPEFRFDQFLSDDDASWVSNKGDGWSGGGIIGFNVQNGNFVFGAEADISFSDIEIGSATTSTYAEVTWAPVCEELGDCEIGDDLPAVEAVPAVEVIEIPEDLELLPASPLTGYTSSTTHATADVDWYGTARLKAGYAFDNVLAYVTGGLAFGEVKLNGTVDTMHSYGNGATTSQVTGFSDSSTEVGFALGAGVDVAVTPNFIVGAFYQYVDLGSVSGGASNTDSERYLARAVRCPEAECAPGVPVLVDENGEGSGSASADANFHTIGLRAVFKFDSLFN